MEDFTTRTYGTRGLDNRPLFGETSPRRYPQGSRGSGPVFLLPEGLSSRVDKPHLPLTSIYGTGLTIGATLGLVHYIRRSLSLHDRIINLAVGSVTSLLLIVTLISAFVFPQLPPKPVNIFFAFCISLCSVSAGILIYWYRQGDLEPKFRNLIYYILFSIIMLCICANLYFHEVGK